jgi:hypothetical protein
VDVLVVDISWTEVSSETGTKQRRALRYTDENITTSQRDGLVPQGKAL